MTSLEVGSYNGVGDTTAPIPLSDRRRRLKTRGISGTTKDRLIVAAVDLGAKRGFSNVTLRTVVQHAQSFNISAVHYHFKGRPGLLAAILERIDAHWPAHLPVYAQRQGVAAILHEFWMGLDDLCRAAPWEASVVTFLARLMVDDDPDTAKQVTAFLVVRLNHLFDAIQPHCPAVPPNILRLRLANACLLLVNVKGSLHDPCLAAAGAGWAEAFTSASFVEETLAMAVRLVEGRLSDEASLPTGSNVVALRAPSDMTEDEPQILEPDVNGGHETGLPNTAAQGPETAGLSNSGDSPTPGNEDIEALADEACNRIKMIINNRQ